MTQEIESGVFSISCKVVALLIAVIGHELMHGLVARHYGDMSARDAGRLSLNPLRHIDLFGTILLPLTLFIVQAPFLFGWAKPVPVDMRYIVQSHGYGAAIFVSLAGIIFNLSLAILASLGFGYLSSESHSALLVAYFLLQLLLYNALLAVFNLWPIPPLDGSRALGFLCLALRLDAVARVLWKMERWGFLVILAFLATPLSEVFFYPVKVLLKLLL